MRGEKMAIDNEFTDISGSPPHARGKGHVGLVQGGLHGITPACAGKSNAIDLFPIYSEDHPRMRGEKRKMKAMALTRKGSPPHARGKVGVQTKVPPPWGITPACAGKSDQA